MDATERMLRRKFGWQPADEDDQGAEEIGYARYLQAIEADDIIRRQMAAAERAYLTEPTQW